MTAVKFPLIDAPLQFHYTIPPTCYSISKRRLSVGNLACMFDTNMRLELHVNNVCKAAFVHIRRIEMIRKLFLTNKATEALVKVFDASHRNHI